METKNKFLKFYLLIISIVATLGTVISLGFIVYTTLEYNLISDEEYVLNSYNWEYRQCSEVDYTYDYETGENIYGSEKTPEEISACEEKAKTNSLQQRKYSYKSSLISESTWFFVFLVLFVTHFPFFLQHNREKKK